MSTSNDDPGQTSGTPPVGPPPGQGYPPPPGQGYPPPPGYPPPGQGYPPGNDGGPGAPPPAWQGYGPTKPTNGLAIAALVVGVVAILTSWLVIGGVLGIVALVLGIIGLRKSARGQAPNRGMAIAGVILGVLAILVAALALIFLIDNADEFEDLADCLEDADTDAEAEECEDQFAEDLG